MSSVIGAIGVSGPCTPSQCREAASYNNPYVNHYPVIFQSGGPCRTEMCKEKPQGELIQGLSSV